MSSAPPKGTATCGDRDSTGNYNAVVSYAEVKNVQGYFAQVGTTAGGNDVYSEYIIPPADNSGPNIDVFVKENVDYFTQYAYTYCSTCNQHDTQNWSAWSPTLGFKCPE